MLRVRRQGLSVALLPLSECVALSARVGLKRMMGMCTCERRMAQRADLQLRALEHICIPLHLSLAHASSTNQFPILSPQEGHGQLQDKNKD